MEYEKKRSSFIKINFMKQIVNKISVLAIAIAFLAPVSLLAQEDNKDNAKTEKNEAEQIIITRKGDKNDKIIVEVNGDKITVNGKPMEDYKDGDLTVRRNKIKDIMAFKNGQRNGMMNFDNNNMSFFNEDANRAMLGVTTEKVENGVEVQDVTKESAAEKAGLKSKDIITKIDGQKIEDPDGLSKAIGSHKPGDKVKVTFLRDNKEQTVTAELIQWKAMNGFNMGNGFNYKMNIPNWNMQDQQDLLSKIQGLPGMQRGDMGQLFNNMNGVGGRPRLGLSIQDTEDGKGVKVLDVDGESNAQKAGIKENDIIKEIDGKAVNSADEVAKIVRESKDKSSLTFKIERDGKTQNIEVKIPRKLKTIDL